MENAAFLETEATVVTPEIAFPEPRGGAALQEYLRGRASRIQPHVVEPVPAPELQLIPTPARIRLRELCFRFGAVIVFALVIAAIVSVWPPF